MWADRHMHPAIIARDLPRGFYRGLVIRVHAQQDLVIVVEDDGRIMPQHLADPVLLVPQRHEYRNAALRRARQLHFEATETSSSVAGGKMQMK